MGVDLQSYHAIYFCKDDPTACQTNLMVGEVRFAKPIMQVFGKTVHVLEAPVTRHTLHKDGACWSLRSHFATFLAAVSDACQSKQKPVTSINECTVQDIFLKVPYYEDPYGGIDLFSEIGYSKLLNDGSVIEVYDRTRVSESPC